MERNLLINFNFIFRFMTRGYGQNYVCVQQKARGDRCLCGASQNNVSGAQSLIYLCAVLQLHVCGAYLLHNYLRCQQVGFNKKKLCIRNP